jgi:amino acid adenylation domain-containing protein/non-ribosomal peptide synthase protein (TIGR01720 family)
LSLTDRISSLSPEQRALFEKLREKQRQAAARPPQPPSIPRRSGLTGEGDWPLSLDQERFWFMEQLYPGVAGLNIGAATRMRGPVVVPLVAAALDEIARRHAAWRTTFPVVDGRPVQRVAPSRRQSLALVDLTGLPEERREPEAFHLVREETAAPFDLANGPLVRSSLVRLAPQDHFCLLTIHHLVTDWISFQIVWGEMAACFAAHAAGRPMALPEPPVQYSDFSIWQREWLQGEVLEGLVSWWRERLADVPLALELPTDRPRPPVARMKGGQLLAGFPAGLTDRLRALARGEGATLFMAVLAAFGALLHRHSGQEKLILGANNANRNRPEIEPVLGCFLTQAPFPIDLAGDPSFKELLARVRQSALGVYAHQDLPFGKLVEAVQPERDTSRQPIVQALVQVLDGQPSGASLSGVSFEAVETYDGNARYDLMLTLFDYPTGLNGTLEYDADLFDRGTAEALLDRLGRLLETVVEAPGTRLSGIPLLAPEELERLRRDELTPPYGPPPRGCVHELIAERVRRTPEAEAVVCGGERLTYRELDARAAALAFRLRSLGVEPEAPVAVCVERSVRLPAALLGVLKAGGVYLPIDPEGSPSRTALVLEDSGAAALVTEGSLEARLPESGLPRVRLDEPLPPPPPHPESPVLPENLAYLIYTSGSTGRPKGVAVTHAATVEHCVSWARAYGMTERDRVLQLPSAAFDASVEEIVTALITGATLVMRGPEAWGSRELDEHVRELGVTVMDLPTAFFSRWVQDVEELPPSLRQVCTYGEELRPETVRRWSGTPLVRLPLLNCYGPTETVISATLHAVRPEDGRGGPLPIGRPLPGRAARVLDVYGNSQPAGAPGELALSGPLARGYLGRPDLTAERFTPDPWSAPGGRLYRSGDLARRRGDGAIEFLGRVDDQVKVRGFRVEPGEIEAALTAHPGVREAAVLALGPPGGERRLTAFVVPEIPAGLRAFLRERLPDYMLPAVWTALPALPLNTSGKVDRNALVRLAGEAVPLEAAGEAAPRTPEEELLAGIWAGLLGRERVGIHDNFFQLGGDSILSIQAVAAARRAGLLITARQFFEHQTVAGLAAVAERVGEIPGADQAPVTGEAPLTPIQRRFFAEGRREPWRYNQALLLISRERLEMRTLAASLDRLAAHHDALRLRFVQDGDWRQSHAPVEPVPLYEIDLRTLPEGERTHALEAAAEALQSGLDLARGPLFTAALFRLGDSGRLLLTAHHLVVDGVSWRVLLEDLVSPEPPPKTTSWKRWAELLAEHARSPELAAEIPYWSSLPAVPPLPLDAQGEGGMATLSVELGAAETRALLQEAPEAYRTQVNDLLLAALARAFAAWTGEDTLLVDLEGHGREEIFPGVDLSRTVGWFTTTFPVALPAEADPRSAILKVKETLRAVPGRGLGFGLLRWLAAPESLPSLPEPQVSFNYLGRLDGSVGEGGPFALAPEPVRGVEGEAVPGRALFAIDALVLDGRLRANWTYDPGRHLPETVLHLAEGFLAEVAVLTAHCLSPEAGAVTPSDVPLARLGQADLDRLLGDGRHQREIEDVYPLAPLQEGILVHSLYTAGSDIYFEQLTAELEGPLDPAAFAAAWQRVIERHPVLRTGFLWKEVERPLQVVHRRAEIPWTVEDWRGLPPAEIEPRWQGVLATDRARGFDLGRPPLMRLTLARTAEGLHRLAWSSHHLLFDGWCFSILLGEVFTLLRGEPLPPPPRPYRDYIAWLAGRDESASERWWRERLGGFTASTPMPFDHPEALGGRHAGRADEYFERVLLLPSTRARFLGEAAQRLRVTLNTLVQAAWALLLSRWSGETDVTFGAITSGRPAELPGVESMVGLFINSLPVRVGIPAMEPAASWLARLQAEQFELRQHEWTPLSRIQEIAGLSGAETLFSSLLVFENFPVAPAVSGDLGELRIREAALTELTNYPLTLIAVERGELALRLAADRRFEPVTVLRLLSQLVTLLEGLAADPQAPPESLPLLTAAERHQAAVEWNDTASGFPEASIPALFLEQATLRPEAVAVEMGEERLTYGELRRRAERIARRLMARGLHPGEPVAVPAERTLDLIPSLLGILLAGGAYLPADSTWPRERLEWMVRDAGASLLPEEGEPEAAGELPAVPAEAVAFVIYTSGSTGTPKGVAVTHRNAVRLVRGSNFADLGPDQAWLQLSPVSFDLSTLEIWAPLLNGGRLVLFPGRIGSLEEIGRVIAGHGVTSAWLTAGLFHEMVDGNLGGLRPLRQLLAGGDVVSAEHARRVLEAHPGLTLIDGYGPTECATFISTHRMTDPARIGASVPIGRPVANDRLYVLDAGLRPLPTGAWGDLYAGGAGVSLGYLGRPELTAESFVPDPFGPAGARLYRTGDRARWTPEGVLEFQGRADAQLKVRGFRIEPAEVEAALLAVPGVRRAAVVGAGPSGARSLAAFWVGGAAADELRAELRRRLPEAMVPTVWVPVADLPLTRNGKVDRRALAAIALEGRSQRSVERVAPRNPLEEHLVEATAEVLGRDPGEIGVLDNFFDLGGHSLLATRLVSLLHSRWGIEAPIQLVFDTPHLAGLADRIMEAELAGADDELLASVLAELEEEGL